MSNFPRKTTYNWYMVHIGADLETNEPKEIASTGRIVTKIKRTNKIKKEVMAHLGISEDVLVVFQCLKANS